MCVCGRGRTICKLALFLIDLWVHYELTRRATSRDCLARDPISTTSLQISRSSEVLRLLLPSFLSVSSHLFTGTVTPGHETQSLHPSFRLSIPKANPSSLGPEPLPSSYSPIDTYHTHTAAMHLRYSRIQTPVWALTKLQPVPGLGHLLPSTQQQG